MRFVREVTMRGPEDCAWLRKVHLTKFDPPPFESFVLAGNEDSPARVDLYASRNPEYNEHPILVCSPNEDGDLVPPGWTPKASISTARKRIVRHRR